MNTLDANEVINYLEDIQSYVRDLLYTIEVNGDAYVDSPKFREHLEHLRGVVTLTGNNL